MNEKYDGQSSLTLTTTTIEDVLDNGIIVIEESKPNNSYNDPLNDNKLEEMVVSVKMQDATPIAATSEGGEKKKDPIKFFHLDYPSNTMKIIQETGRRTK